MSELFDSSHYSHHEMVRSDASGNRKVRDIYVPDEETKEQHLTMLRFLYDARLLEPVLQDGRSVAPGGMPGATLLDNVLPHVDSRTYYALDLADAFPSVNLQTLKTKVADMTNPLDAYAVGQFIDEYVAAPNLTGLPVGAPCSPYLFNVYLAEMDEAIRDFCDERSLVYTRWLDDITISSTKLNGVLGEATRRSLRSIIESTPGMSVNHIKSRLHRRDTKPVTITGVSLYPDGRLQPGPAVVTSIAETFAEIEADIYNPEIRITDLHVARLNGYHGAIVGMSREPYSATIGAFVEQYHMLVRLAHAAIAMDTEPPHVPDPERRKLVKGMLRMIEASEYRAKKAERLTRMDGLAPDESGTI